jgi:class 3 adenylate cyclase/tetratricopeptide (TPR) repeat protein
MWLPLLHWAPQTNSICLTMERFILYLSYMDRSGSLSPHKIKDADMSCSHCKTAALSNAKYCRQCGSRVGNNCPACGASNPPVSKFCGECGKALVSAFVPDAPRNGTHTEAEKTHFVSQGERRHLTILFADLTGYTRMMEQYDPEDVQALMTTIIRSSVQIIESYNGHVERVIGDEVLALFGLPVAHEDDAIRAIKAAREIHETVMGIKPISPALSEPHAMHTGINTGLVVTARSAPIDGTFDLSGDAVNLASRLSDLARPNEILVGPETYRQAFGFFDFDTKPSMRIKGKSRPISVYAVKCEKDRPMPGQRKLNHYSALIGRQPELDQLLKAMEDLKAGKGGIITIVGEAGTGKSRLLQEFEKQLVGQGVNSITGYAFAHTQQVPYFPLVHLVRRWLELDGSATAEEMATGIAQRVGEMLGPNAEEIPIIQGLIGQDVQETVGMSPEEWRERLKSAMLNLMSAIARQAPTVFCMEDVHWGDAASYKLLKDIIFNFDYPALVINTTRPHASLFTSHEQEILASIYTEIRLGELSPAQTEQMMESMLDTDALPADLCRLIRNRAEGNPFYLEEILNALVDSKTLAFEDGCWQMNRAFKETDIPSTIHGIIASRMDQLGPEDKRILQEAAVIGRAFLYEILKQVSVHGDAVDASLYRLERAGLIKPRALHPEMEFMFKHALIQEVSYGSLLRRERQRVHERIGRTIERLYQDRLSEFDETLAIHFQKSTATDKATDYLIRSGTKALRRCALDESDQYFKTAKSMLEQQHLATPGTKKRLLDVVNQWAFVFYYKGLNRQLLALLEHQQPLVDGLKDPVREGYHWAWHGCALWHRHRFVESYDSLIKAKRLAEKAKHPYLTGYACTWLSWPCTELGRFAEAIENSEQAEALFVDGQVQDPYIYFNGLFSKSYAYWHIGDAHRTEKIGHRLIKFGNRHGNVRSLVSGHCTLGWKDLVIGDIESATACFRSAVAISADPWYSQFPKLALCYGAISNNKIEEALPLLDQLITFSNDNGAEFVGDPARFFKGLTTILSGQVAKGLGTMETLLAQWQVDGCRLRCLTCGYVMARVYLLLFQGAMQSSGATETSHMRPMADKCIQWFTTTISEARAMGAQTMEGQALLGLGNALSVLGDRDQARDKLNQSIDILSNANAAHLLQQAKTLIKAL